MTDYWSHYGRWLTIGRTLIESMCREGCTDQAPSGAYQGPPHHIQFQQNFIFALRVRNPSGSSSMCWSSSTQCTRGPHLVKFVWKWFIYQLEACIATIRDHATHVSPIQTRKLDPWRPGGKALIGQKGLLSTGCNSQIRPKTRIVTGRINIFFPQTITKTIRTPPKNQHTRKCRGARGGALVGRALPRGMAAEGGVTCMPTYAHTC